MQSFFMLSGKFSQLSASKYSCATSQQSQLTMSGPSACRDNGTDERQEEILHVVLGGCPVSVWENIDSFLTSQETFCNVYGPQFDTAELDVVSAFENIFYIALVQLIVDETNKYVQQEISKSIRPLTFRSRIRKWEDVTVDEMYMGLALFMLIGIIQKPTLRS
jgi:hypothetical protein